MGYLGDFYDRNDRTTVCKDNSDNIICFTGNRFLYYYKLLYIPYPTWAPFREPSFGIELKSIEIFRFFYFIGY